jgi:26S proteasome regulatory subunit N6
VNYLAIEFMGLNNSTAFFALIREIKDIKNTNNTFLVKLTGKLIGKLKKDPNLFQKAVELCQEIVTFCEKTNNISMKNRIQTRLAEIYLIHGYHIQALDIVSKAIIDLKRYEDNLGLITLQLIESKIHFASKGISKAKAALTSVKTLCTKVYIEPKLQAEIDMHAGILSAQEKDFNLSYSYFYESFDVYNMLKRQQKALKAIQYMILSKIMSGSIDDVNNIVYGKQGQKYYGREIEALRGVEDAVRQKSVKLLKNCVDNYIDLFSKDTFMIHHLTDLQNELLEKNLIKIIQPYSVVEIEFVTNTIGLPFFEIISKLSQMILDKKINGILDQGRGSLIIYEDTITNVILIFIN